MQRARWGIPSCRLPNNERGMRFLIDAQLPQALAQWFEERGHEAAHVRDVLGGQAPDHDIADHARHNDLVLVTKDDDFVLRHPPTDYGLIWLRCGNMSNRRLCAWLDTRWSAVASKLDDEERMIEVR